MYKRVNLLKQKLERKENVSGCIIQTASASIVEILGMAGFDFVYIDCEHSSMTIPECENLIRAAELYDITPIIRTAELNSHLILRYLDIGAQGITISGIHTAEEIRETVRAVKYYPVGMRGLAGTRANEYGMGAMPLKDYTQYLNEQTVIMASIETIDSCKNIEEITAVEGLDAVLFGANDLSQDLGYPGQTNHPEVVAMINEALEKGLKSGVAIGSVVRAGETPADYFNKGYTIVQTSVNSLIGKAAKNFVSSLKE